MNAKISVLTSFACFILLLAGCSRDNENIPGGIEPPKTILDAFNLKYPEATDTEWTVDDDYYVIGFKNNHLDNKAWFSHTGVWAMIKTDLPLNQLPEAISASIRQSNYADWLIEEVDTIGRAGMGTVYKVEVEKGKQETDLYYTVYGNLIKAIDDAVNQEDIPIVVPDKIANLMEVTFAGAELLDIEKQTFDVKLAILDKTVFKTVLLNEEYSWQSTTWQLSEKEVPATILESFNASEYSHDKITHIYIYTDADGAFYKFSVIHNGQEVTVTFDVFGNIVSMPS